MAEDEASPGRPPAEDKEAESILDRLCPMIPQRHDTLPDLPFVTWPYKPYLTNLHRGVLLYIQSWILLGIMIIPLWALNAMQDDYYAASQENTCLQNTSNESDSWWDQVSAPYVCYRLTEEKIRKGWRLSPVQGHANRYGLWYQFFIYAHQFLGYGLVFCCILIVFIFIAARWCLQRRALTLRKVGACTHYCFLWLWVLNITAAVTMAFTRILTLGTNKDNWNWSFTLAFFVLFYFIVMIVLLSMNTQFHDDENDYSPVEQYLYQLCTYAGQSVFLLLGPLVMLLWIDEAGMQSKLGFTKYDRMVVSVVLVYVAEPFVGNMLTISTGRQRYYRCISACTLYFITVLTEILNLAHKYGHFMAAPALALLAVMYVGGQSRMGWEVWNYRKHRKLEDPNFE